MKKRRIEFLIALILIVSISMFLFSHLSLPLKAICLLFYFSSLMVSMYSLMLENRSPQNTLLWIYVLAFFPVFGYLFYLFSGQLYLKGYLFKNKRKKDREEWKRLLKLDNSPDLSFLQDSQLSFAKFAGQASPTPISTATRTFILKNGEETFSEIIKSLKKAEKFIHLEYYIFRSDSLGKKIMNILMEKAKAGVEVLFIYDAAGSRKIAIEDLEAMKTVGIKVQPFSPLKYGFFNQKVNFRNHRKIIIIDGEVGFAGGLNVGIEYVGKDEEIGFWRDTHMLLKGEAVYSLHMVFLLDWEYVSGEKVQHKHSTSKTVIDDGVLDGAVQVVASGPDTQQGLMSDFYFSMIASATKSIWIASPYFIPDESIRTALRVASAKGIEVRIIVPEINDGFLTQYASQSYFPELLRYGVEIYAYKKGFLHQKVIIIDGNLATLGTANMDMRSFHLNFEVNMFLYGTSSIRDLVAHYEEDMEESEKISPVQFYKRGFIEKSKESFARLFSGVL